MHGVASGPAGRSTRETPPTPSCARRYNSGVGITDWTRRRDSKPTDVYEPPAAGTTLQESGRRIPLRHSDNPDYDAVSVSEEAPRSRAGLWTAIALIALAALGALAWRFLL